MYWQWLGINISGKKRIFTMAALYIKNEQAREEENEEDNHNEQEDKWTPVERKGL